MKKLFTLFAVILAGVALVACTTDTGYRVDIFIYRFSDTYIGGVRASLEAQLEDIDNVTYRFHDADNSQETQNTQIDTAITSGTKLLVVNIVETGSADTVIAKARAANLPIIFFNREVSDAAINSYDSAAFIGTDPDEAGYLQGELAADIILEDGAFDQLDRNGDGKIGYVMLRADLDNPEANGRTTFSIQEANRLLVAADLDPLDRVIADQMASWDTAIAKTLFDAIVSNSELFERVDIVFANNDDMAIGVIQSLNAAGYNLKDGDLYIPVLGVDATATAQQYIRDGQMAGSILQDGIAMATALAKFIENSSLDQEYTEGTNYEYEATVAKLRIPYAKFTG